MIYPIPKRNKIQRLVIPYIYMTISFIFFAFGVFTPGILLYPISILFAMIATLEGVITLYHSKNIPKEDSQ